jgi:hypothetical protein
MHHLSYSGVERYRYHGDLYELEVYFDVLKLGMSRHMIATRWDLHILS